jgi:hypothetical protein
MIYVSGNSLAILVNALSFLRLHPIEVVNPEFWGQNQLLKNASVSTKSAYEVYGQSNSLRSLKSGRTNQNSN